MRNLYTPVRNSVDFDRNDNSSLFHVAGLIFTVSLILLFGLTMLYSTSYEMAGASYFIKQSIWAGLGVCSATLVFFVGYKRLSDNGLIIIGICSILLLVAAFCFPAVKGAHRWIRIPGIGSVQPSEFAKLAVMLFLAKYCSDKIRYLNDFSLKRGFLPAVFVCVIVAGLILLGQDLGTTVLLAAGVVLVFFVAGLRLRYILLPALVAVPGLYLLIKHYDPERWARLTSFLNPELCRQDEGLQLWNSQLAFGSGNWFGLGFTESRIKAMYLPEAHTDFLLSIVGEELGFLFISLVILSYIAFMYFAIKISINSRTRQGMLLGVAVTGIIVLQAVINIGVVSGAFPTKGMPAPFISYGGSNLIMCLTAVGLLVSIAIDSVYPDFNREIFQTTKSKLLKFSPANWL